MFDAIELSNGLLAVRVRDRRGVFDLLDGDGRAVVTGAAMSVVLGDGTALSSRERAFRVEDEAHRVDDALGSGRALTSRVDFGEGFSLKATVTVYDDMPYAVFDCELQNHNAKPVPVARFEVLAGARLDLGSPLSGWRFYKHGWQSWSPTLVLDCAGEDVPMAAPVIAPGKQPESREGRFVSDTMSAIFSSRSGKGIVAGFVTTGDQMSQVWLDRDGETLTAASYADGITVLPGGRLSSERLLIEPTSAPLESMERYGDALGRSMGARPSENVASGWCSWYYYWQGVTEAAVLTNVEELRRKGRYPLPVEYVQIDDGWQAEIGDWLAVNEKFPHGLNWLVERIHEAGFKAGLWLAPFLMGGKSRLWKEHSEWAIQCRAGKPFIAIQSWGQDCYALDLTRPAVIEWLKTVFLTVCEDWGFDYVKIDFIYAGAVDGIRDDPELTRAQAYRQGVEAIREAVDERFILGCGSPMGASVGLVDGARISPDVAPCWEPPRNPERSRMSEPSALNAIRNTIMRWWMQGRLWQNDPDCLLARESESGLTPDEVRSLGTVIAMSGGMVLNSDDLARLSDERREWLSMLLPPYGKAARPLDLFEAGMPRLLEMDCGSHRMLALFNWSDESTKVEAQLRGDESEVFDAWTKAHLGVIRGSVSLEMPPHGCRLLAVSALRDRQASDGRVLSQLFRWPEG